METIHSIINLVTPCCWMASLDRKDAYYKVEIHPKYQKFLKFKFEGQLYQYAHMQMAYHYVPENLQSY